MSAGSPDFGFGFAAYAEAQSATRKVLDHLGASFAGQTAVVIAAGLKGPRIVADLSEQFGKTFSVAMLARADSWPAALNLAAGVSKVLEVRPMRGFTAALTADAARSANLKSTLATAAGAFNGTLKFDSFGRMAEALAAETARSAKVASILAAVTERTYPPNLVDLLAQRPRGIDLLAQQVDDALDRVDRLPGPRSPLAESPAQPSAELEAPATSATDQLIAELPDEVRRLAAEVSRLSAGGDVRRVQ